MVIFVARGLFDPGIEIETAQSGQVGRIEGDNGFSFQAAGQQPGAGGPQAPDEFQIQRLTMPAAAGPGIQQEIGG